MRTFLSKAARMSLTFGLSILLSAGSSANEMDEYRMKALFLYNFTQFVEWPVEAFTDSSAPLLICLVQPSPFEPGELEAALKGRSIDAHPLASRLIRDAGQTAGCQIVFFSVAASRKNKGAVNNLNQIGTLTVGETPGFAKSGGVVNFAVKEGRVKLEINVSSAEKVKLRVSAKLLKLAEIVK